MAHELISKMRPQTRNKLWIHAQPCDVAIAPKVLRESSQVLWRRILLQIEVGVDLLHSPSDQAGRDVRDTILNEFLCTSFVGGGARHERRDGLLEKLLNERLELEARRTVAFSVLAEHDALLFEELDAELIESVFAGGVVESVDHGALGGGEVLEDFPVDICFFAVVFVFGIGIFAATARDILGASETVKVEAGGAVEAVLVVAFVVVFGFAVMGAGVETFPLDAADVAEVVATFASDVVNICLESRSG
jgi:hypothetical protein